MSRKMYSISFLSLMFLISSAMASERMLYNGVEKTLTIPVVNVDDQAFYYLKMVGSESEGKIRFNIVEAKEIGPQNDINAHFSTTTSRLSLANVGVDAESGNWIINLDLVQGSSQFTVDSLFLPTTNTEGNISKVDYIDNTMEHYAYRFNEQGKIDRIETERFIFRFLEDGIVRVHANYGAPIIFGTHGGDLHVSGIGSGGSLYQSLRSMFELHHSETTNNKLDHGVVSYFDIDFQSLANALSIPSWLFACASAAINTNSWEPVVMACERPIN